MGGTPLSGPGALHGRRVVLGVTGGIAAYKAVEVCRRLMEAGAWVTPVLTDDATRFIGEVTFSALASEPVRRSLWEPGPVAHLDLARRADVVVVVPATANLIARCAMGLADDLLGAVLLATRAPVLLAPAMHTEMWEHPATCHNVELLRLRRVHFVGPIEGPLAGADEGPGRLAEPASIVDAVTSAIRTVVPDVPTPEPGAELSGRELSGVRVLVSAGGTREPLDPVRYIANRSSGKQGHALAAEAASRGARVTLVTTAERPVPGGVEVVKVETAAQMAEAVLGRAAGCEVVILAAAVADWRPAVVSATKLHRACEPPEVVLEPVPDISAAVAAARMPGQVLVGFAAEAAPERAELVRLAASKLAAKGLDLVVANDVSAPGVGFDHDTNAVTMVDADGVVAEVGLAGKATVARAILDEVVSRLAR